MSAALMPFSSPLTAAWPAADQSAIRLFWCAPNAERVGVFAACR